MDGEFNGQAFAQWAFFEIFLNGKASFPLEGSNMKPTINHGEMVTVESVELSEIKIGDVVLHVTWSDTVVLQRVVRFVQTGEGKFIVTRGDNSLLESTPVPVESIIGRATKVERNNKQISIINSWPVVLSIEPAEQSLGGERCTILVVEDNHDIRSMLSVFLSEMKYKVIMVSNGLDALEIARSIKPDLIVTDIEPLKRSAGT